ncbi:MAG TPA: efflux RND transporter permease subunit, partial [Methylococcaceae bacterium]|nr:efflux RND transporter permease subunit [Methylococcaceae bacterium]
EPSVSRFDPDDLPILSLAVLGEHAGSRESTTFAERTVKRELENLPGVGRVVPVGGTRREIQILLQPEQLLALQVGVDEVIAAIRSENRDLPAGSIVSRDSEQPVQVRGRIAEPLEFGRLIVARRGGEPVYLSQVAAVRDGQAAAESIALVDGRRAVGLDILKAQGANTLEVAEQVRRRVAELQSRLPAGMELRVVRDTSTGIRQSVADLQRTLLEGGALTLLIVFLLLNSWRSAVITGLTLPIAVMGTFFALHAFGYSLNKVTLMALSLCVGLLIDDAIVVRDNISRHLAMGKTPRQAALEGTREIGLAVLATTSAIVAVFLPVAFMDGMAGRFLQPFGVTVAVAVLISMLVSFTLDPMLSSVWHDPAAHRADPEGRLAGAYRTVLDWGLAHRKAVLAIACLGFFAGFPLLPRIGTEFVPEADLNEIAVAVETPAGSSLEFTQSKIRQAEGALREFPEVAATYAVLNAGTALGRNAATLFAALQERGARRLSQKELQQPFRERLSRIAGLKVVHVGAHSAVGRSKPLQVSVQGREGPVLENLAGRLLAGLGRIPGVVDLDSSLKATRPAVEVRVNRERASDLGLGVAAVAAAVRPLLAGEIAGAWKGPDGESYDVDVRLPPGERHSAADLERLYVAGARLDGSGNPLMVPLRQVADFAATPGPARIERKDLQREVLVTANVAGRAAGDAARDLRAVLAGIDTPPGYRFAMAGASRDMQESAAEAASALSLAVVFLYLVLASQFGSFTQPLGIMLALPLSLAGVLPGLWLGGSTLNLFSVIGFILLMGLVAKNAILLVDFANRGVAAGLPRREAILEAGAVRLRPILMTTLAMIAGMLPMALGLGAGGEQRAPMAHAVIGGLVASTLLTLIVVPVVYTCLDDLASWVKRRLAAPGGAVPAPAQILPPAPRGATVFATRKYGAARRKIRFPP